MVLAAEGKNKRERQREKKNFKWNENGECLILYSSPGTPFVTNHCGEP